ncbi:MAG: histidine kinase [Collinsella sp.]
MHDNVGHQLTRASLQAEALRVVHADEPGVAADFADVKRTVDEALQLCAPASTRSTTTPSTFPCSSSASWKVRARTAVRRLSLKL